MRRLKRIVEVFLVFVAFPVGCLFLVSLVVGFGLTAFAVYLGALLAAWLFSAYLLPMLLGVMTPDEIVSNIRSRRVSRTHGEGEPLPTGPMEIDRDPSPERAMGFPPFESD
jgi:hypothetical protein